MVDLAILYREHARVHYRKDGDETSEVYLIRLAMRHLVGVHGTTRARDFSPRQSMIDAGWVRTSINSHVGRISRHRPPRGDIGDWIGRYGGNQSGTMSRWGELTVMFSEQLRRECPGAINREAEKRTFS